MSQPYHHGNVCRQKQLVNLLIVWRGHKRCWHSCWGYLWSTCSWLKRGRSLLEVRFSCQCNMPLFGWGSIRLHLLCVEHDGMGDGIIHTWDSLRCCSSRLPPWMKLATKDLRHPSGKAPSKLKQIIMVKHSTSNYLCRSCNDNCLFIEVSVKVYFSALLDPFSRQTMMCFPTVWSCASGKKSSNRVFSLARLIC